MRNINVHKNVHFIPVERHRAHCVTFKHCEANIFRQFFCQKRNYFMSFFYFSKKKKKEKIESSHYSETGFSH